MANYKTLLTALLCFLFPGTRVAKKGLLSLDEHIQEEFAPFPKITLRQLDKTEELLKNANCPLMRVKITRGISTYHAPPTALKPYQMLRIDGYVRLFEKLAHRLPDLDLIIVLSDTFRLKFLGKGTAPVFCMSKLNTQKRVLCIPEIHSYPTVDAFYTQVDAAASQFPWEHKSEIAFWRGSTTGGLYSPKNWMHKLRTKLVTFSKSLPEQLDCAFHCFVQGTPEAEAIMRSRGLFGDPCDSLSHLKYKYLMAIDGNSFPSSLKWQLFSGSVVLKNESNWIEWFSYALTPYEHYVPYKVDCSDLREKILWLKSNDLLAKEIAHKASQFARSNLTSKKIEDYVYTLLVAYSKRLFGYI
jgi:hypothetical protein